MNNELTKRELEVMELDMFENYEDENASFSENENKIPYLELAKQTGANRCIYFNWSNNINETCYKSDKDINKCLLLGGTKCTKSGVEKISECEVENER